MIFDSILAIDWSGARYPTFNQKIQVAQYDPAGQTVWLVDPPDGEQGGHWSRTTVFGHIQRAVNEGAVLIGFDFAFAYPYCDQEAYFPGEPASPPDRQRLWATVEECCIGVGNFYAGPFYRGVGSPFRAFHLCHDSQESIMTTATG